MPIVDRGKISFFYFAAAETWLGESNQVPEDNFRRPASGFVVVQSNWRIYSSVCSSQILLLFLVVFFIGPHCVYRSRPTALDKQHEEQSTQFALIALETFAHN